MIIIREDAPWFVDLEDENKVMLVNGEEMPVAIWNMICSKRDLTMWVKHGMKANRHWKVTDVKKYFDIKGSGPVLLANFMELFDHVMEAVKD
jgi:hypothetical protein|tara:strand:+ start:810 stop:1085 length:276 start_codon:yes stop_codon:yes gene_type:complete